MAAAILPKQIDLEEKAVYHISNHPMTNEEWIAKYCEPDGEGAAEFAKARRTSDGAGVKH